MQDNMLQCRIDTFGLPVMVLADTLHLLKSYSLHRIPSAAPHPVRRITPL